MRKIHAVSLAAIGVIVGLASLVAFSIPVHADSPAPQVVAPSPSSEATVDPAPRSAVDTMGTLPPLELPEPTADEVYAGPLAEYTLEVMNGWTHAVSAVPVAPYEDVARDIALAVAMEADDPGHCGLMPSNDGRRRCLWGVPGWNSDHTKAVLLAAVGYWEGARYAASVDDGSCNDKVWRTDPANEKLIHLTGNCDGGRAHSLWQIWPRAAGSEGPIAHSCDKDAVAQRSTAARCALQILRMSMMETGSLVGYTGESAWGDRYKANLRQEFARKALKKHPWRH